MLDRTAAMFVCCVACSLLACDPPGDAAPSAATAPSASAATASTAGTPKDRVRKKRRHSKGGISAALIVNAVELDLSDEQRATIKGLAAAMKPDKAAKEAQRAFSKALGAGVRAGKIDDAVIDGAAEPLHARVSAMHKSLNQLHATLTAEQRKELALAVGVDAGERIREKGKLMRLVRGLDLSDDQRKQVRALMESDKQEDRSQAVLDAFASDGFDAAKILTADSAVRRKVAFVKGLVEILDEQQRDKLAARLEREPIEKRARPLRPRKDPKTAGHDHDDDGDDRDRHHDRDDH